MSPQQNHSLSTCCSNCSFPSAVVAVEANDSLVSVDWSRTGTAPIYFPTRNRCQQLLLGFAYVLALFFQLPGDSIFYRYGMMYDGLGSGRGEK